VRTGEIQEVKIDGVPLGMFPDIAYETVTLDLRPGDIVVFASDGILESMNPEDEEFGFDRLARILRGLAPHTSAERISASLLEATEEFSGRPTEAHDDRTLIILRFTGSDEAQPNKHAA
jgi:sigma-B regulation protein RsbU (phosphoserine phosphatase)